MVDTLGATLSLAEDAGARADATRLRPALVLALECQRPRALSARYDLGDVSAVVVGRGSERKADRLGTELTLRVPDRWMSSRHARLEPSFGRWVLTDTDSKNGTFVNGQPTKRSVLADGDLVELGHTLFIFCERLPLTEHDPAIVDLERTPEMVEGLATLIPEYGRDLARLRQVASSAVSILVEGDSGTGKEVLARAAHALSGRDGQFIAVNCGAIAENLVESELFGHKKGAFSGAHADHDGLVRAADKGTLFLDEIGDLPAASQAALLRVLQEREVTPVGGTRPVAVDVRIIAATHRDLDEMIADGQFRHDLFARLAGFRIAVPPLAERRPDLGILIGALYARHFPADAVGIDLDAARLMFRYVWPLNIRELEQALTTASVLAGTTPVLASHLPDAVRSGRPPGAARTAPLTPADEALRDSLCATMREHRGNISAVARAMNKDRKQIQRWVKRFGVDPEKFR
ncbi:MAG: sigma 54-interacting transcriptional regulator [Kofleriaceae bacterium]